MKNLECKLCKGIIDKDDPSKTWITITEKWYMLNDKRVPNERYYVCDDCWLEFKGSIEKLASKIQEKRKV